MSRPTSTYGSVPSPGEAHTNRGYGTSATSDFAQGNPNMSSPLSQSANTHQGQGMFHEDFDASQRGSSIVGGDSGLDRATSSNATTAVPATTVSRNNTLKKKNSVKRMSSLKRSSSKRSLKAGSIAGFGGVESDKNYNSAFSTPVPTQGAPTEVLANRFQAWRQLLKSLIAYFREIQQSYETRAKAVHKIQNSVAAVTHPAIFMSENGLSEATRVLDEYHKRSVNEANKSRDIENDVIGALTGLRSDLGQKIKEIKSLSGDFKNSVEKEQDATRREVEKLQDALQHADHEDGNATGRNDPFVVRLGVDRSVEKQIDEENYLHRAYLNLESSGRELESIVVGEIQKAYNALAGILKREGDDAHHTVDLLRTGPIAMPKDAEWNQFVEHDASFVNPNVPLRRVEDIDFPGKHHPAAQEVRAGMLERKSKYLKSYTPGWYILSATHLHEFKSAEKIYSQPPVMSLYLGDQKLGSRSQQDSSSHKFMLKGKQSGTMHKGHNWVFRAESYETMMAWYEDIRNLTEATGAERNAYVRKHARSVSGHSDRHTISSDGMEEDEADAVPYTADARSLAEANPTSPRPQRPQPGGRFPSDMQVPRQRDRAVTGSSDSSDAPGVIAAAGAVPGSTMQDEYVRSGQDPYRLQGVETRPSTSHADGGSYEPGLTPQPPQELPSQDPHPPPQIYAAPMAQESRDLPMRTQAEPYPSTAQTYPPTAQQPQDQSFLGAESAPSSASGLARQNSTNYGDWMAPAAVGAGVAGAGAGAGYVAHQRSRQESPVPLQQETEPGREMPQEEMGAARETPETYQPSGYDAAISDGPTAENVDPTSAAAGIPNAADAADPTTTTTAMNAPADASGLGGLERQGAHETGHFPKILRHDTEMSVSNLHVPGEYPKK